MAKPIVFVVAGREQAAPALRAERRRLNRLRRRCADG
jgi:hypothetical protein